MELTPTIWTCVAKYPGGRLASLDAIATTAEEAARETAKQHPTSHQITVGPPDGAPAGTWLTGDLLVDRQPPAEDLRNAVAIARVARQADEAVNGPGSGHAPDFARIEELIETAFQKLGEPLPVVVRRTEEILHEHAVVGREARDAAAVIMTAALEWR